MIAKLQSGLWWEAKPDLTFGIFLPSGKAWWESGTDGMGSSPSGWSIWRSSFFYIQEIRGSSSPCTAPATGTARKEATWSLGTWNIGLDCLVAREQPLYQNLPPWVCFRRQSQFQLLHMEVAAMMALAWADLLGWNKCQLLFSSVIFGTKWQTTTIKKKKKKLAHCSPFTGNLRLLSSTPKNGKQG